LRESAIWRGAISESRGLKGKTEKGSEEGACSSPRALRGCPRGQACSSLSKNKENLRIYSSYKHLCIISILILKNEVKDKAL